MIWKKKKQKYRVINYRKHESDLNAAKDDADVCGHAHEEVKFVDVPQMRCRLVVDEAKHRCHNDSR